MPTHDQGARHVLDPLLIPLGLPLVLTSGRRVPQLSSFGVDQYVRASRREAMVGLRTLICQTEI
jgi:hypothetical protein